jgi:ornithine cyclodeaminase
MNATTGVPIAFLDGTELTLRRTAAASALASSYLSRKDAGKLLMIGTGNLAPHMIKAHCSVRPIKEVCVWGRRPAAAKALVEEMPALSAKISVADNLEEAVANADVISCATLANEPIVKGDWLVPGQHLDLVGAFTPAMAEADTTAVSRAAVFVDTREGALAEAGEIVQAIQGGSFDASDIRGSLGELCRGTIAGRTASEQITLFKSVGTAIEDLAAAELAMRNHLSSDAQQST